MNQAAIEQAIIGILKELQAGSGETTQEITPATTPILELGFFDSLLALETTIALEERLNASWDEDSVFTEKDTCRPRTISEIAARIVNASGAID